MHVIFSIKEKERRRGGELDWTAVKSVKKQ